MQESVVEVRMQVRQEANRRRERWTLDVIQLMTVVILAATAVVIAGAWHGEYAWRETTPVYVTALLSIGMWWLARNGGWRIAGYMPLLLCYGLGAYSVFRNGYNTGGVLFFAMSITLGGIIQTSREGVWMAGLSIVTYALLGSMHEGYQFPLEAIIPVAFGLCGVALLQWYAEQCFFEVYEAQAQVNLSLQLEAERRARAESVLKVQETQLRRLAENTMDLVTEITPDGVMEYISPSYQAVLGFEPQTLLGKNAYQMLHPEDLENTLKAAMAAAEEHRSGRLDVRVLKADGAYLWVEISGTPLYDRDGRHIGFVLAARDIHERIEAELARRASDEKFSSAFMTSPDSININRLADGVYLDINLGFTKLMGYTRDETLGKSSLELNIWADPEDRGRLVRGLMDDGVVENLEARFRRKNGEVGIGLMSARVIVVQGEKCILSITRDVTERLRSELELRQAHTALERAYEATLVGWARALELRERETANHSQRVVEQTVAMASALGISGEELVNIRRGAMLHDIGKVGVPDSILLKPAPLTPDEWVSMRQHVEFAYDMLSGIEYLHGCMDIPYCHHERWDGTGYPRGLAGEEIPLAARIFAVVDVYDALTHDRPYRPAWSRSETRRFLVAQSGKHFDPAMVDLFLRMQGTGELG